MNLEEQQFFVLKFPTRTQNKLLICNKIIAFSKSKHREVDLTNSFKIEYIRLLCLYDKRKVLEELETGKYPPTECLEIVEYHSLSLPMAYLKRVLGNFNEANLIYKDRIRKAYKLLHRRDRHRDLRKQGLLLKRLKQDTNRLLSLCIDSDSPNEV